MDDKRIAADAEFSISPDGDYIMWGVRQVAKIAPNESLLFRARRLVDLANRPDLLDALEAARKENAELRAALDRGMRDAHTLLRGKLEYRTRRGQWGSGYVVVLQSVGAHETKEETCPGYAAWLRQQEVQG